MFAALPLGQTTTISSADIPTIAISSVAFLIYRLIMLYGPLDSVGKALEVKKRSKFINRTFDMIHYIVSSVVGVIAMSHRQYGHCFGYAIHCRDLFFQNPEGFVVTVFEKLYFYIFFSYYAVDLFFIHTSTEKAGIMILHHVLTLSEVVCCVILRSPVVGLSIMLLHDISDVPLYFGKFLIYLGANTAAQFSLAIFAGSITYFRILNYPIIVYYVYAVGWNTEIHQSLMRFQTVCLGVLYGLHIMWQCKIVAVIYHALVGGKVKDVRSD
jgi:hypothetical protein